MISFGILSFTITFSLADGGAVVVEGDLITGFLALLVGFFSFFWVVFFFISGVADFVLSAKGDFMSDGDFSFAIFVGVEIFGEADFVTGLVVFLGALTFFFGLDLGFPSGFFNGSFSVTPAFFCSVFAVDFEDAASSVEWTGVT